MAELTLKDFSAGWIPGDDPTNGRKNGLLLMQNLELDALGSMTLQGGCSVKQSGYGSNAHSLFSTITNGARHDYLALVDGSIYRDNTSIAASGGDSSHAAFGTAFNYTLIASGDKRIKDKGTGTPVNLGINKPTLGPSVAVNYSNAPRVTVGYLNDYIVDVVGSSVFTPSPYARLCTCDSSGSAIIQTYGDPSTPYNLNSLVGIGTGNTGYATDGDIIRLVGYTPIVAGRSVKLDILLVAGNSSGDMVSDYYTYTLNDLSQADYSELGAFIIKIKRSDFTRIGTGSQDWSTVYGFRITYLNGAAGEQVNFIGSEQYGSAIYMIGGTRAQNGQYQYMQINVNNDGAYVGKSMMGPLSNVVNIEMGQVLLTPQDPSAIDAQVNEVWIFRKGGLLSDWYRVAVFTSASYANKYDTMSDLDALVLNIKYNSKLISIASSSVADKIYDIIGPVNGRWYYFTTSYLYPSDINNPDLVDSSIAVKICGSNSELLMWARQLNDSTILVGTSLDIYTFMGTFNTFPDFSIDAYYRPLHCKYPPLTRDADVFSGVLYYLASDGWRLLGADGTNTSMVSPNLDRLYRIDTNTAMGAAVPDMKIVAGSQRFPIVITKNKMWCCVYHSSTPRIEVYDFVRQYWRYSDYGLGNVTAMTRTPDGQLIAFYSTDKKLRELDIQSSKLIDGATKQTIKILTPIYDNNQPFNRKDSYTFKALIKCSDNVALVITVNNNTAVSVGNLLSASRVEEKYLDLSQLANLQLIKNYKFDLQGTVSEFILSGLSVFYDPRPTQLSFLRIPNTNFGTAAKKRVRNWPIVIDSLGNNVVFTPTVDNTGQTAITHNTSNKDTKNNFYKTDVQGVDYGGTLYCSSGLFEFYEMLNPEIVQLMPVAKQFDQIGPEELFRFGKVKQVEFRLLPYGTSIPFNIYFNDSSKFSSAITTVSGVDASYFVTLPKGVSGTIVRIELGPTDFDFLRFYIRLQVAKSGRETELEWLQL